MVPHNPTPDPDNVDWRAAEADPVRPRRRRRPGRRAHPPQRRPRPSRRQQLTPTSTRPSTTNRHRAGCPSTRRSRTRRAASRSCRLGLSTLGAIKSTIKYGCGLAGYHAGFHGLRSPWYALQAGFWGTVGAVQADRPATAVVVGRRTDRPAAESRRRQRPAGVAQAAPRGQSHPRCGGSSSSPPKPSPPAIAGPIAVDHRPLVAPASRPSAWPWPGWPGSAAPPTGRSSPRPWSPAGSAGSTRTSCCAPTTPPGSATRTSPTSRSRSVGRWPATAPTPARRSSSTCRTARPGTTCSSAKGAIASGLDVSRQPGVPHPRPDLAPPARAVRRRP